MREDPAHKLFEALVRQHHRCLLAYGRVLAGGDGSRAEELVQDALVIAFRRLDDYDPSRDFGAWVRGIVRNLHRQKQAVRVHLTVNGLEIPDQVLEQAVMDLEEHQGPSPVLAALRQCLEGLGELLSGTVRMHYFQKMSVSAVAAQTQASEDAIKKRLQRAREMLFACIRRRLGDVSAWEACHG